MNQPIHFPAIGKVLYYLVPASGRYVIEATGAQGGAGGGPGGKGARVRGTFELEEGDVLQIVVGQRGGAASAPHHPADIASAYMDDAAVVGSHFAPHAGGGGGGGTFVWKFDKNRLYPLKPMLVAGGGGGGNGGDGVITRDTIRSAAAGGRFGRGGEIAQGGFHYSGGGGAGWLTDGAKGTAPTYCAGGTHWTGGSGAVYQDMRGGDGGFGGGGGGAFFGCGSGGGGGFCGGRGGTLRNPGGGGGTSYNAGLDQANMPGVQAGDGHVTLVPLAAGKVSRQSSGNPFAETHLAPHHDRLEAVCGDAALARALRPPNGSRPPI